MRRLADEYIVVGTVTHGKRYVIRNVNGCVTALVVLAEAANEDVLEDDTGTRTEADRAATGTVAKT